MRNTITELDISDTLMVHVYQVFLLVDSVPRLCSIIPMVPMIISILSCTIGGTDVLHACETHDHLCLLCGYWMSC